NQGRDDTDRRADGHHAVGLVGPQHADRPLAEHVAGDERRVVAILQDLVLVNAVARLVDRQPGQLLRRRRSRPGHGPDDVVEGVLVGTGELLERAAGSSRLAPDVGQRGEIGIERDGGHGPRTRRRGQVRAAPSPRMDSTSSCGRGMRCTDTTSPTFCAATAPASVAAFTAPTSPRTMTVTSPPPICSRPTRRTLAALIMASAASIAPTSPRVSMSPRALLGARTFPSVAIAVLSARSLLEGHPAADDGVVDDGDDSAVGGDRPARLRHAGRAAGGDDDEFVLAGADQVDGQVRSPRTGLDITGVDVGDEEEFEAFEPGGLDRRHDLAYHPCELHWRRLLPAP